MSRSVRDPDPPGIWTIHASAVQLGEDGLVFLGPSRAGKSTIRRLLSTVARSVADDLTYVTQRHGVWAIADANGRASDGPLSADEAARLETVPLRAVFRLHQAAETRVEPMGELEACQWLTHAFFQPLWQPFYDTEVKKRAFAAMADLARAVPAYDLYFALTPQTTAAVITTLQSE